MIYATCDCDETHYIHTTTNTQRGTGRPTRSPYHPNHSCEYVEKRNKLIHTAALLASQAAQRNSLEWSRVFNLQMNALAQSALRDGLM